MKKVTSRAENPSARAMARASSARAHHYQLDPIYYAKKWIFFSAFSISHFMKPKKISCKIKKPAEEIILPHYLALTQQILWGVFFYLPLPVEKAIEKEHLQHEKF